MTENHQHVFGKGGILTEVDIVRFIVKDLIESYAQDKEQSRKYLPVNAPLMKKPEDNEAVVLNKQKKTVFKLYMRLWITCMR